MTALPSRTPVLIVGAGPTGLTLAIALRRQGVECLLIDRLREPLPWSRALGMHARTLEILDALDVLEPVSERCLVQKGVNVYGRRGRLFRLDLTTLEAPHPYVLSCPQAELEAVLAEQFVAQGGHLLRGCELLGLTQSEGGVLTRVRDADGEHSLTCNFLVGCDGASSRVRTQLGFSFEGVSYPDHFLLADLDIDWPLSREDSHGFLLPEGALIAIPMPEGWRLIINQRLNGEQTEPTLEDFRVRLAQCLGSAPPLSEPRWISRFSIHRRLVNHYRRNRVFLAGDACHIQSPLGAQGMNTGIADAFNLGWKLALYLRGHADGALLDSYERERRPVARKMLYAVDILSRSSFARNPLFVALRDLLLMLAGRRRFVGQRLLRKVSQLEVSYRQGPLAGAASPSKRGMPDAGDRAPDAQLSEIEGSVVQLHAALRRGKSLLLISVPTNPGHAETLTLYGLLDRVCQEFAELISVHLILPGSSLPEHLAYAAEYQVTLWQDKEGQFASRYSSPGGVWLIRPDGHIGWRGELGNADHLVGWCERWLRRR